VRDEDQVWHLGDFARGTMDQVAELLSQPNGHKHLIIGNNDEEAAINAHGWSSVQHYKELLVEATCSYCVIIHFAPGTRWDAEPSALMVTLTPGSRPIVRQYDVGIDAWSFRPVTLETLVSSRQQCPTPPS
jgi:calcineurin-like phosphoesterase family protein